MNLRLCRDANSTHEDVECFSSIVNLFSTFLLFFQSFDMSSPSSGSFIICPKDGYGPSSLIENLLVNRFHPPLFWPPHRSINSRVVIIMSHTILTHLLGP